MARQCLVAAIRHQVGGESSAFARQDLWQSNVPMLSAGVVVEGAKCKQLEKFVIGDEKEFFQVEVQLPPRERQELIDFLRKNIDVFAWKTYEAPRVDPNFICHRLNINPSAIPEKQPP